MPNSYTTVPTIIPGTLNITGDLDVKGEIRVGAFTARTRIVQPSSGLAFLSHNIRSDFLTKDDAGVGGHGLKLDGGNHALTSIQRDGPNDAVAVAPLVCLDILHAAFTHTGVTTEDPILNGHLHGSIHGAGVSLTMRLALNSTVQGATPSTVRVRFGATQVDSFNIAATGVTLAEWVIMGDNDNAHQRIVRRLQQGAAAPSVTLLSTAVDISAQGSLQLTVQNGAGTDSQLIAFADIGAFNLAPE